MGLKDALRSMQRCLGKHAAVVHVAVKIRNQCNGIIRYHLGEDNVSSAFFLLVEQPCMNLNWPGELLKICSRDSTQPQHARIGGNRC
jgi:hypothetical protein